MTPGPLDQLIRDRFGPEAPPGDPRADVPLVRQLLARRSIRRFTAEPIPADLLETVLAATLSAPSKSDLQQVSVIHLADPRRRAEVAGLTPKTAWAAEAAELLVFCGDGRRIRRVAAARGRGFANEHLDSFMNAAVDAGIALAACVIAAESLGLGCCPLSELRDRIDALGRLLELPEHVFPVAGLALGWPAEAPVLKRRLPLSVTLHRDRYDDSGLIAAIEAYDRARAAAEPVPPERQRHAQRWPTAGLYGWSEDRTRQYAEPLRADFGAWIRRQGFGLD